MRGGQGGGGGEQQGCQGGTGEGGNSTLVKMRSVEMPGVRWERWGAACNTLQLKHFLSPTLCPAILCSCNPSPFPPTLPPRS